MTSTIVGGVRLRLAEFVRQPATVAAIAIVPLLVVETFGVAVEHFPPLPGVETGPGTAGYLTGAVFAVAVLAGVVGLFQVISARSGDERLLACGYPRSTLLATRLLTMVVVAIVGAVVALAAFTWRAGTTPEAPALALGALLVAGLTYGLLGVLIGTLLPRALEGSLVLVFLVDVDLVLASGFFEIDASVAGLSPLYHPHRLVETAIVDGTLPAGHAAPALASIAALTVLAVLAYVRVVGSVVTDAGPRPRHRSGSDGNRSESRAADTASGGDSA